MLRTILTGLIAICCLPAFAADMPVKAPYIAQPVPVVGWQGLYVGIHGGENLGSFNPVFGTGVEATAINLDDNSPFVGGHIYYLAQLGGLIIGPELGLEYWGFKKQAELAPAGAETPAVLLQQKVDWVVYANLRAGFSPLPSAYIYVTGGAVWAHAQGEVVNLAQLNTAFTQSVMGWNAGVGLDYKLAERIILGIRYTHFDFGTIQPVNPLFSTIISPDKMTVDQIRGSLSVRLN
jgi:outer membrane immunogenic protein